VTKRFQVTKPLQVTKRRCALRMPKGRAASTAAVAIDGADSKGKADDKEVCGDAAAVSQRRSQALRRRAAAIQERLDKIKPVAKAPVSAAALAADRASMTRVDGIVAKTAGKVATDERTFDQFVNEQAVRLEEGMYPSAETMVEFAAWLTRRRERVCLAQRVDSGPRLVGLVRTTIRNMLTELFAHVWPRRFAAWRALSKQQRAAHENEVLEPIAGLHKLGSQVADGSEATARGEQLRAQTGAVSTRKHFYRTEVFQIQDVLLKEKASVNCTIVLGAATAFLQATAARSGMFTKDEYDKKSAFWCGEQPLRVRDIKFAAQKLLVELEGGGEEATARMQINWRRVKRQYYEVYLFRSALTANAKQAVRRVTVWITTLLLVCGRFRACRAGMSAAQVSKQLASVREYGGLRLCDTAYESWEAMLAAVMQLVESHS